ncbi:hypothetical protein MTR67_036131 [Solanum verrucosum]|uniref:Uncharacterized protein n=1 Tax=Solanum verrucosum TaxID=315347 RepID=A0AAF0UBY3_SOLVR|nr:hypothetical protein MTR67_036131 [Solanum verrucosum]
MPMHLEQPIVEMGVAAEIVRDDDRKIHLREITKTLKRCHKRGKFEL